MMNFLEIVYYHNSIRTWLIALGIVLLCFIAFKTFKSKIIKEMSKFVNEEKTNIQSLFLSFLEKLNLLFISVTSLYIGSKLLHLSPILANVSNKLMIIVLLFQIGIWGHIAIQFILKNYISKGKEKDPSFVTISNLIAFILQVGMWILITLLCLDNLGFNITALVAGVGIGGLAISLAAQNILKDLFASVSIVFDKPFIIGDSITVGSHSGTVTHIGLKTTRLTAIGGEELIFSNGDLLESRINNYKRMTERRVLFTLGFTYQTPHEKLVKIPSMIKEIIESQKNVRFARAHFKNYNDSSLDFEIVYFVTDPNYDFYMDVQQDINFAIFSKFAEENIEFAYPTRTIYNINS